MIFVGYVAHIGKKSNVYRIVFWDEMKEGDTVNIRGVEWNLMFKYHSTNNLLEIL
jgi:hypothetical protein